MSFCRITGRSRGLPKPNYFPLLAPISPADAKRCCRITGKSYGLPSHHYIPVLLASRSGKTKCKITNVSGELGPHHYSPEINYGNRKHDVLPGYRYIFPVLDGSTEAQKALIEMLSMKQITEDKKYVYTVDERRCSLVFCARMEAAVRDGDVRDVMLAKDSDTVLIKTKQGRNVSMDFKEFVENVEMFEGEGPNAEVLKQREKEEIEEKKKKRKRAAALSSMKKIFENKEKLAEVQEIEEDKLKQDRMAKKAKLEVRHEKHDLKSVSYNNFDLEHMRSKSSLIMCNGDWRDQVHPLIESFDWDLFDKNINEDSYCPKVNKLPTPLQITPYHCEAEIYQVDNNISENSVSLENVPCVNPLKPIKGRPSEDIINAIREIAHDRLTETLNVTEKMLLANKIDMIPNIEDLPEIVKHIKKGKREKVAKVPGLTLDINKAKKFLPGQHINTPQGPVFIAGQTIETPTGPVFVPGLSVNTPLGVNLIPGHIIQNENNKESVFLAGQIIPTPEGDKFVCGQVIKTKDNSYHFTEGQTVLSEEGFKFVPGKIIQTCSEDVFVPGQTLSSPDGIQFIPGQTSTENGDIVFTPGQNVKIDNEWQFVPGQVVHKDNESHFIPGATLATPNGLKFIPGQTVSINGEPCFVPGITRKDESGLKFIPGTNVDTPDGPKFLEGQIIQTNFGEKFVPGKTITLGNGNVEFSVAKSIEDVQFSDSMPIGLPINIKTCSVSEESLYVFGHMVQTSKGIEFYPGSRVPKNEGKVVPGRLVKNDVGESRFVPGTMVEGIFVPGQIVFTENGEQFVPGQVVDTSDGPKFVPGQVVNTKSGPKFVPGQTIHTIDGPRFVPGQIIETKAGPTFIPGQVISTDEGSRFVPGQVVDTEEGPRFVPGRVIENDDNGVTFVPGQIVQTPEGLKFVAPDLIEGDEGLEFSVQSFLVTPEELKLLKVKTNPNDTTSTKGELTIDTNMLKQLSEAGMSIGRQVPAELPAINVILNETKNAEALKEFAFDFGLKDTVANQLMDVIKSIIEMSVHLKTEIGQNNHNSGIVKPEKSHKSRNVENPKENESTSEDKAHEENIKNSIAAAVLAALVTAEQFQEINNNNGKEKYQQILKSIDTILGKTIDEDFVTAMYNILQKDDEKEILCDEILENTTKPKLELIRIAVNRSSENHPFTEKEIVDKFSDFLKSENEVLGPAFKNITKTDTNLLHHVLGHISEMITFVKSDQDAAESLQKAIVSAVQETSSQTIINMLQDKDPEQKELKELITQSIGLARVLGMNDVAKHLLSVLKDDTSLSQIANDDISMNILKRLTVMRKLAEQTPDLHEALVLLGKSPESARTDPKLRELVRESAALMIIPEEGPLLTSADVPLSLLQPENSLAMEDFLFKRKKCSGALLIMKRGLQAVVPREASRAVLTGEIAYTVLDENGIKYFEPLHVFSALNLSQPIAHRFSMYSCPIADEKDDDLQNYNGYCNISNSQITTRLGGLGRRYSHADRETTRNGTHSYDYTPSYKRYQSRSLTRSRSTCSKSPPKVDDVVVATSDYTAVADDEVSVKAGDIVEVLDTKAALGSKSGLDKELDVEVELLDSSAARHKIAVRPKKNHPKVKAAPKQNGERWLVRVLEDVQGDELSSRQGYVPAHVLREKEPERDITALAARRQAVIRELIETEEEFGRDMQQVVSQYMRPMDKATTPKPVFESREFLFSNFKQICEFHNTSLLEGIKYYAADPRMLGRALLRMEREFDKHVAYCRDEPKARQLLSSHPVIKKYFQEIAKKVGDDKGLAEHLKLPIQRINDYQLLLKELVKYSKRLGDDSTDLQKALELFLGVPNRATNNLFIASIEGFRGNIYKLGRLLTHDWFTVEVEGTKENLYLFLFKARILISKIKRVADDRSVFVLQQIIRIPDIEIKDHPESLKFELHQKNPPLVFILKAQKEQVKTAWLREIRQYASDLVALAEHAADDLQVLPPEDLYQEENSPEIQEETKKRERSEEVTEYSKEKKSRVEESEENKEENQIPTKRKASIESDIATKLSKSEVIEATSDIQEALSTTQDIASVDLESKSVLTPESTQVSEVQSITSQSQTSQKIIQEEVVEAELQEVSASKEVSTTQTVQVHCTEVFAQGSVQEVVETACKTQKSETTVEASQDNVLSISQQSIEKLESVSVEEAQQIETEIKSDSPYKTTKLPDETTKKDSLISVSRQTSKASRTLETSVQITSGENVVTNKEDVSEKKDQGLTKPEKTSEVDETSKAEQKRPSKTKRESKKKTESVDYSEEERDAIQIKSSQETASVTKQTVQQQESLEIDVIDSSNQIPSSEKLTELPEKEKTVESFSEQKDYTEGSSKETTLDTNSAVTSEDKVVTKSQTVESEETGEEMSSRYSRSSRLSGEYSSSTRKSSTGGRYESSDGTGISTYSRRESGSRVESSRIDLGGSIEGSAASRYESKYSTSAIDNGSKYGVESSFESRSSIKDGSRHGGESTYESRRSIRDGSKYGIESGYEGNNSTTDGIESSYESRKSIKDRSKYDRTNSIKDEYGVESSYGSRRSIKDASKYSIDSSFDKSLKSSALESSYERSNSIKESKYSEESEVESKIDSIAAKYGLNNNIETKSTKVIEAAYDVEMDAPSKIDSIASKYGRNSITESVKSKTRSTRLNIETNIDGNNVEAESQFESKRQSKANGRTVYEEEFSKNALLNGSLTSEYESKKSVSKSESFDGRPIFTKTLEGQNIEPGENALFECEIQSSEELDVTWLKDNKPLTDKLMDRVNVVKRGSVHKLEVMHCREDDAGLYTARAQNKFGNAHCTAQLIVHELTPEERKQKNALNAPYFIVALKDTEILLNTYLRFMVKVKGNPNPDVKFYREGKEITTCLDSDRVSIVRTRAEKGCYELVISDVNVADAGKYSCKAINIYGEVESECTVAVVDDKNIFGELPPGGEGLLAKGEKPVFAWKRDGLEFDPEERFKVLLGDDEDSLALVFQHVKPEDAGMYTCVAKTSTGNISCSAELTVQGAVNYLHREPEKPTLEIEHREAVVSSGGSAMLELVCKGYPKPTVVWKHKGDVVEADARHKFLHEDDENMSLVIKNVTSADSGVYEVTASNDLGDDTTTFNLVVTAPPKIKKKIENQTCMVETSHTVRIEVEGTPAPEVSFYKDGVLITSSDRIVITKESDEVYTITIKDAKLTDTGSYSIVAKNEVNQCSDFWQWHVTSPPKVIKKLGESKVCDEKETVTFEVKTESDPTPTVTWFKNKTEIKESSAIKMSSSGEAHKLVITSAARADAGEYSCEIRNVHGSTSDSCLLNVRCGPVFTQRLKDTTSSEGDVNVEFTVDVEAYPEPQVQWYLGDVEITEKKSVYSRVDNGSTHKLILKEVTAEMSGQYSCRVTNDLGADSCQATFTVNRKPRITKSLVDMTVDEGQTLKLEVEVEGCPEPKVKWYKDGKEVNTDARIKIERDTKRLENYHLTVTLVKEEDGGEYEVRAENEMGSVSCKSTVTVHTKEVHSRFTKGTVSEKELDADSAEKQKILEDLHDDTVTKIATKEKSKPEVAEEISVLDDAAKPKTVSFEEVDKPISNKARKSLTEPENIEKKSVDDMSVSQTVSVEELKSVAHKPKKSVTEPEILNDNLINEQDNDRRNSIVTDLEKPAKPKKSFTEPEVAEKKELLDDSNKSKCTREIVDESKPYKAQKSVTEPEIFEEKSFWDDVDNDGMTKTSKVEEVESVSRKAKKSVTGLEVLEEKEILVDSTKSKCTTEVVDEAKPYKAQKSVTEPEIVEEKSFWDDVDNDAMTKTSKVEEVESVPRKAKKSVTEPEVIETGSVIDENQNEVKKVIVEVGTTIQQAEKAVTKPEIIEEVEIKSPKRKSIKKQSIAEEPLSADTEGRVFETVTTFKSGDDGSITVSKVSSTRSHGAIITGPAETRTLHKMTTTAMHYDENDECDRKIIIPNKPHTTSLEVEEIASHSYFLSELGYFTIPDHIRRGTYGIIEEPQTDSDADSIPRMGRHSGNRTYSIRSASEDEMSWQNDSLSREISIEDLSKSLFEIDETKKVFSKDSYVRQTSFKEDYYTNEGEEEYVILKEKSEKVFERDVTEKLIDISKEFEDGEYMKFGSKKDNIKNRLVEELVLESPKNITNITKNIAETTVERKRKIDKSLFIVEEEDGNIEELLKRSQRQRSILDDILNSEEEKASPTLKESSMKDGHTFESLPLVYTVEAVGQPKPTVRWLHNGEEVKPDKGIHLTNEGDVYKLAIDAVDLKDIGKWQCEISNKLGKQVLDAELAVSPVAEYRKPIFRQPLEAQRVMQREPVTLKAICTADPLPHVAWLLNGNEIVPDATVTTSADSKELEHGLKECTFTLQIPTGRHQDTGVYTIQAKNQYGIGECSARLDILLRPEIEGLKDVTTVPYEETTFVANIRANPIAEVKWSKDGYVIQPSANIEINEDLAKETYSLTIKKIGVADAGVYTVTAKNEIGETAQQAKLTVHTNEPKFTKPLQKQTVKDYDDVTLKVRCDGVPKPDVKWYKEGIELANDERRTITTEVGGQVDSELEIKHFNPSDAGKYKAVARNLSGEASTEADISLAQLSPGFVHKLDRQKEVDEGEPLELKAKVDGSPIPTAQWFKDGVKLPADDHVKQVSLPDGTIKLSIDHVTPSDCGAYKLIISNPNGEHSALCAVAINPTPRKPSFSQELEDAKVMVGQPVKLEARVMAFPAPEVKWFKDGLPIRPSQAVNFINQPGGIIGLAIDSCKPEDAGVYSLTLSNKLGEAASKASVEVAQKERKPAFIAELMPSKVIEGFPVKMEVKVLGHPQPIIKWTHNGKEIVPDGERVRIVAQPDGTHALLLSKATAEDAGKYGVVAINDKGETASTAELSVASRTDETSPEERPQFLQSLREVTADEGQPLTLSAPFVGNPVPEVSWSKDGQDLKPSDRILLTCDGKRVGLEINPVERPDAGVYSVKLVNPMGEDKTEGKIHVRKVFQPPAFTQKFTDLQQLPSFDAKFPARISGIPAPEVTWYKNGAPLSPSNKYQMKRDGDACCLYVRDLNEQDAGQYKCVAKNKEGQADCEAALEVVDKISRREKVEPPSFLKKIGDVEVFRGLSAKFTACATGTPEPDVEWFRNDEKLFPCERIRMDKESTGLLRLTISGVDPSDVGSYRCRIFNPHGEESCIAQLTYDTLEPQSEKKPISEQYSEFDKMKATGVPMPLSDKPIISRMADRHLTLSWKPSIPHRPRFPVTYQVEMCEVPDGDWFTARTGLRSCVCDIRNLEPFRDYKFRVRVENKYGVSDPSPYAITHRAKLEPDPPKFIPYLEPGIDFRPETSPYFPKDFDIERPPHDGYAQAPKFLRQEYDSQYGVKGHNVNLFWFVYGYPKPKMTYYFNDEPIEVGGRYDWSYTRNGQAALFINKMLERDVGWYEAVATNEHGQARQRVRLELAEYPQFIRRPEESVVLVRKTARIEARVTGQPYPEIKWYKDWQPIAPSSRIKMHFKEPDTVVLVIHDVILKDEGLYSVSARNPAGAVSSSAMLHVEECEHEYSSRVREHPPRIKPSSKPFGDFYDIGDELGRGVQGVVYHAAERLSGRNYAAKIMHGHSDLKPFMKNELEIMNLLNDRHLVRLHDAYEHDHTLALVMELASGGELVRDRLLRSQGYTERDIAGYVRQLLRGLKHMHDNSIAHLGLTIGELLLSHVGSDELKICDFGLSRRIHLNQHAALNYGMPEYVAPEVAKGEGVAFGADMWSVGIITYILLSGRSPFKGLNDRETLTRVREGQWEWFDEEWWSRFSLESRDFISKLLVLDWRNRLDVDSALAHPWLSFADKIYKDEYIITTDRLRSYYNSYRDWMSNASCRTWFRRRPLEGAFDHPSRMVYPPGELYTPEGTPDRDRSSRERKSSPWDLKFKQWDHPDWEVSATSESHYQNGPDTYLLQLRDTQFPVRLREYMKVACHRSPAYNLSVHDSYDPRTPIIRERRRFTDVMDEEIDDERKERINQYGSESYTIRRLRHELGTRLDSYAEAQAFMESKKDGHLPFFREKPQILPVREGEPAQLSCYAVGDPKPVIQWFKNDMVIAEGQRIKIIEDDQGRSTLKFDPAMHHDIGFYKVVARNKVGQTVARTRIVEATTPNAPDSPTASELSDTEVLLRWKQPKYDGNSPVVCYSLQFKEGDSVEWKTVAENIDHEFFVIRDLVPQTSYQFRLSSRNRIGWSEQGIPTNLVKTLEAGAPKIQVTKAMKHLQQMTESGQEIVLDEDRPKLDYATEEMSAEWGTTDQFTERYSFVSELWRGKFSIVVKGIDKTTDSVVVAKILECRPETEVQVQREFECLRRLRHERISNLFAAYQTPGSPVAALVLEKLQGADILTYLSSRHEYSEQVVATVITQVLDGLQYLHWRGYCHLDLQPDNVVLASVRSVQVKLVDFGSAHKVTKLGTIVPQVGELDYKAPEVINDEAAYPQTDIWSVGVLAYILLSGVSPFRGSDDAETKQNISFVRYRFEHLYKEITQEATRFLMFIFKKTPLKRPTAEECYEHRWLHNTDFMLRKRERAVFLGNRLKEFSEEYHSRKSAEASEADSVASAFPGLSPRMLARSNSIQDELMTNFTAP